MALSVSRSEFKRHNCRHGFTQRFSMTRTSDIVYSPYLPLSPPLSIYLSFLYLSLPLLFFFFPRLSYDHLSSKFTSLESKITKLTREVQDKSEELWWKVKPLLEVSCEGWSSKLYNILHLKSLTIGFKPQNLKKNYLLALAAAWMNPSVKHEDKRQSLPFVTSSPTQCILKTSIM